MIRPDRTTQKWGIREADNQARVCLMERHDIGHFYTSVEVMDDLTEGAWRHITGSSAGHGTNRPNAEAYVEALLAGGWRLVVGSWRPTGPYNEFSLHPVVMSSAGS